MENIRNHRDIKLETTDKRNLFGIRNKLSNYKVFQRKCADYRNKNNANINE